MPGKGENPSMSMTYSYETVYVNPETHECKLESAEGYGAKKVLLSERIVVSMEIESTVTAARKAVVDKSAYIFFNARGCPIR